MPKFITNADLALPHMTAIFYSRKAFELHAQGLSREEATKQSREDCENFPGLPMGAIFPPIDWSKFELFYPKEKQ